MGVTMHILTPKDRDATRQRIRDAKKDGSLQTLHDSENGTVYYLPRQKCKVTCFWDGRPWTIEFDQRGKVQPMTIKWYEKHVCEYEEISRTYQQPWSLPSASSYEQLQKSSAGVTYVALRCKECGRLKSCELWGNHTQKKP